MATGLGVGLVGLGGVMALGAVQELSQGSITLRKIIYVSAVLMASGAFCMVGFNIASSASLGAGFIASVSIGLSKLGLYDALFCAIFWTGAQYLRKKEQAELESFS